MGSIKQYAPSEQQRKATLARQKYKLYGGAMGGGKTRWLCEESVDLCVSYAGNKVLMLRKTLSDFKTSTLDCLLTYVLADYISSGVVVHNKSDHFFKFWNGSTLLYRGLEATSSTDDDRKKFFSSEYGAVAVDEAREMKEQDFYDLDSRLRLVLKDKNGNAYSPPYYFLMATNPTQNWIKSRFILHKVNGRPLANPDQHIFIRALPKDNKYLPNGYVDGLRINYASEPALVEAYLEGSWDCAEEVNKLIKWQWIKDCVNKSLPKLNNTSIIAADIAASGDDETVIYSGVGGKINESLVYSHKQTIETAGIIAYKANILRPDIVIIDSIGVGMGCYEQLRELLKSVNSWRGAPIQVVGFGGKQTEQEKKEVKDRLFNSLKSLAWWKLRESFQNQTLSIPDDAVLHAQLADIEFDTKTSKLKIESKDEYKKRNGKSPDRADALVMYNWAARNILGLDVYDYGRVKDKLKIKKVRKLNEDLIGGIGTY